jgi:hypothetical protein
MDGFQFKGNCQNNYKKISAQAYKAIVFEMKFKEFLNDSALKKAKIYGKNCFAVISNGLFQFSNKEVLKMLKKICDIKLF